VYVPPVVTPPVTTPPVTTPPVTTPPVETPPVTTPPVEPPYVAPPIYVPPVVTPTPKVPGYGPLPPLEWGKVGKVNLPGLNPGWITNVPTQYAPQGVRSQYYWGGHPYQPGPVFDPALYRNVPAPATPWGLQQMYNPQQEIIDQMLRNISVGPVAPTKV